jgi:cyclophilin family peptidyl-prolyl cis-trans isomerase/HEAT repeat protein
MDFSMPRCLACLVALAALAGACASTPPPAVVPPAPVAPALAPPSDLESRALLLLLADRRLFDPVALQLLLSGPPAVRVELAVTLGRIGDRRGRSLLQGLLVDADLEVRRAAAFALGELEDREAVRALMVAAVDPDPELGVLAVEALGKAGAPLADVRRALGALAREESWRRLAPALFRFREPAAVVASQEGLSEADPAVHAACAYALGRLARPEGAEALRGLLADADPFVRGWAARGLGEVGDLGDLERLEPLLDDPVAGPRIQSLNAGARILARSPALPPLGWGSRVRAALADESPHLRSAALEAAARFLPNPELETDLRERLEAGEPRERELAFAALAAGGVEGGLELVSEAAGSSERAMRARAAEAAVRLEAEEILARLAQDPEAPVRVATLESLAARAGAEAGSVAAPFLGDPDPTVRATALDLLARHPVLASERIAAALDAARTDALSDARLAGVRALAARGEAEPAERPAVLEALGLLLSDRDWLVRREAAAGLGGLGAPRRESGPLDLGRDVAYYREVLLQTSTPRRVEIETERGALTLELAGREAPLTTLSFLKLAGQGYFDGLAFHRVVPDFVVQGGDPRGDGWGGPGYALRDEINRLRFRRGALGMALSGPDTGGSQFFLTLSSQPHLDGGYTVFGRVVAGEQVLDRIRQGDRILEVHEVGAAGRAGLR